MSFSLAGQSAIVTGAAHGIGRAIAEKFAGMGANVFLADLDVVAGEEAAENIRRQNQQATFVRCDISKMEEIEQVAAAAGGSGGRIHCLVNNAAYMAEWHDILGAGVEEWDRSYRVTLMGAANFIKGVLPRMIPHRAGSIINVSSVQGMVAARSSPAYTAMKHALVGLTRNVAYDYGPQNIRCNALCPGAITTRHSPAEGSELQQRQISKTFLGRTGLPEEVGAVAGFLASEGASYITGAVIPVDGGWTSM